MSGAVEIRRDIHWIGARDPELKVFDDLFPTEHGTTYNSYLVRGSEKVAVIDTVKGKRGEEYLETIRSLIDPAEIDYIIVNHTEPDHSGSLALLLQHAPKATVVSSQAAHTFLTNLIHVPFASHVVKEGEVLSLGDRTLRFVLAPFLHWPDTMFTFLAEEGMLFTCDAFGSHYCGETSIFDDELPDFTEDTAVYFDCIMRPFKDRILTAIGKIRDDRITVICPSHGPVLRSDPRKYLVLYEEWCRPKGEGAKIAILYLSPHGNTEKMAAAVAGGASLPGVTVETYHINRQSTAELRDLMESADGLIFGIPTINRDIPKPMWGVLAALSSVKLTNPVGAVFGSYGWSGEACRMAEDRLKSLNFKLPAPFVRCPFAPRADILEQCAALGKAVAEEVLKK